ncbi:MAG TPA: hypothetical protein VJ954_08310 [Ignavibacteriaceae bacterium]|nr:hypothetical protein [Ignavibacteriaceae bacterium]
MKNILVYSTDSNICLSLLMYWQNDYNVTTTTSLEVMRIVAFQLDYDMIIMDTDPSVEVENFCRDLREKNAQVPLVLSFVYQNSSKDFDNKIRQYTKTIFYKPFDLTEVTKHLSSLIV